MRRVVILAAMALGALAIPSSALAASTGDNCEYAAASDPATTQSVNNLDGDATTNDKLVVYVDQNDPSPNDADGGMTGTADTSAGACLDRDTAATTGPDFEGGGVEAGVNDEDPGADGAAPVNGPDAYVVVDGDNDNRDPGSSSPTTSQSDGYVGVSNYETGPSRTSQTHCETPPAGTDGPDGGAANSSNSGGCVGVDGGPWVYVPGDAPTPMCGNSSGNTWSGTADPTNPSTEGSGNRDGCSNP